MAFFAKKQDAKRVVEEAKPATGDVTEELSTKDESPADEGSMNDVSIIEAAAGEPAANDLAVAAPLSEAASPVASAAAAATAGDATTESAVIAESLEIEPEVIEAPTAGPVFGIAEAIHLMRSLPHDPNMDLVVRIVRVTLDAVSVSVQDITEDAIRKEQSLADSIAALQAEVDGLEKQLYAKRCTIAAHEAELKETASVRERLNQADKYTGHRPPPPPPDAVRILPPKPTEWERFESARSSK